MHPKDPDPTHHQTSRADSAALRRIERKLDLLLKKENLEMSQFDTLTADVTTNTSAVESAITLIGNLKAELDAAGTDPTKLAALSATLEAEDTKLAAAVAANTPAAPTT